MHMRNLSAKAKFLAIIRLLFHFDYLVLNLVALRSIPKSEWPWRVARAWNALPRRLQEHQRI